MNIRESFLHIEPLDSLFFRDGRPYTHNESEQMDVVSQCPPSPATLVGAVRAAVARALGWNGDGDWEDLLNQYLGDGEDLGPLKFRGPWLLQNNEALFPAPRHLMRTGEAGEFALLTPGVPHNCDLGDGVRLPELPEIAQSNGFKPADRLWLKPRTLEKILAGQLPEPGDCIAQEKLWKLEARVGIARDEKTRNTGEDALYSPHHIRLRQGVGFGLSVQGLSEDLLEQIANRPQTVGGESRLAWISTRNDVLPWPAMPDELSRRDGRLYYTVVVFTPLPLTEALRPSQSVFGLPGTLVSACLPRPLMLGGWDSREREPLPLEPYLAPGSVLFLEADTSEEPVVRQLHASCIGPRSTWGYGLVTIGTWS